MHHCRSSGLPSSPVELASKLHKCAVYREHCWWSIEPWAYRNGNHATMANRYQYFQRKHWTFKKSILLIWNFLWTSYRHFGENFSLMAPFLLTFQTEQWDQIIEEKEKRVFFPFLQTKVCQYRLPKTVFYRALKCQLLRQQYVVLSCRAK